MFADRTFIIDLDTLRDRGFEVRVSRTPEGNEAIFITRLQGNIDLFSSNGVTSVISTLGERKGTRALEKATAVVDRKLFFAAVDAAMQQGE